MPSVRPASTRDPRPVPGPAEREVLRASLAAQLFCDPPRPQLGRFMIIGRAGAGAMGVVYRAYDPQLEREVALKLLLDRPPSEQERLVGEARAAAKVLHPNVVSIYEVGTHGQDLFVAMEYVDGSTLRAWGEQEHSAQEILAMHIEAGRGLAAAHAAGVIHRDYKPDNVLIGRDGRPRVVDFGLARSVDQLDQLGHLEAAATRPASQLVSTLSDFNPAANPHPPTATGDVLGTPAYMAPEQFVSSSIDARADQYSFCVSLYEGLTGKRPFQGDPGFDREPLSLAERHRLDGTDRIGRRVRMALERGLSLDPDDRFESMDELLDALWGDASKRRGRLGWIGGLGGIGLAAALGTAVALGTRAGAEPASPACQAMDEALARNLPRDHVERLLERVEAWGLEPRSVVEGRIDAMGETWMDVAQRACTEFHVDGTVAGSTFEAQMACLHGESRRLDLTLNAAAQAEQPMHVLPALGSSTAIIDCGLRDVVLGRTSQPQQEPAAVAALRDRFERAQVDATVHGRAQLVPEFEAIEAQARALPSQALQADTAYELASAYAAVARYDDAEPLLHRTYELARAMDDIDLAVDVARFLSNFYTAYRDGKQDAAAVWADIALAELDDPRVGTRTALGTLLSTSHIAEMEGDMAGSLAAQQQAAALLYQRGVPDSDQLSLKVVSELAVSHHVLGRYEEAELHYRRAIEGRLRNYPHDRAGNMGALMGLGLLLHDVGRAQEALVYLERGHASADRENRPRRWVQATNDFVPALLHHGQFQRVEALLTEAETILDRTEGSRRDTSHLLDGWAALHESRGELDEALESSNHATEIALEVTPTDPSTTPMHLRNARLRAGMGDLEGAQRSLDHARSLFTGTDATHARATAIELTTGELAHARGDTEHAWRVVQRIARHARGPETKRARELLELWGAPTE